MKTVGSDFSISQIWSHFDSLMGFSRNACSVFSSNSILLIKCFLLLRHNQGNFEDYYQSTVLYFGDECFYALNTLFKWE